MRIDPAVTRGLLAEYGAGLRGVASYRRDAIEYHYLREDVEVGYSRDEFQTMLEELILEGLAKAYLESLFHAGRLAATTYVFERAVIFHFAVDESAGLVVSIDRVADVDVEDVFSRVEAGLPPSEEPSTAL